MFCLFLKCYFLSVIIISDIFCYKNNGHIIARYFYLRYSTIKAYNSFKASTSFSLLKSSISSLI